MKQELFDRILKRHKKMIVEMVNKKVKEMVIPVQQTADELTLAYAECKCENPKCKQNNRLQYHHLIQRKNKEFTDFWKYMSQRYYWANILILCKKCHGDIENRNTHKEDSKGVISQEKIDKIKKKYEIK